MTLDPTFEKLMQFAESDDMKQYFVDIRSHIDEIVFQTTMQLGITEDEIDELCEKNISEITPAYMYEETFKYKFGYLFWRLYKYRFWKPEDDEKETTTETKEMPNNIKSKGVVAVSGNLEKFSPTEFKKFVNENGYTLASQVDDGVDYLVVANCESASQNDLNLASWKNIKVINEEEFVKMVEDKNV